MNAGKRGFHYVLEPVALTRQWALDALLVTLGECNTALAARMTERDALRAQLAQASSEWTALGRGGEPISVDRFALVARYVGDCGERLQQMDLAVQHLQQDCDAALDQVVTARRAVDAMDEHRGAMWREFLKDRQSGEFKVADDLWNGKQTGTVGHDD